MQNTELNIDPETSRILKDTSRWTNILAMIVLIGVSLSALTFLLFVAFSRATYTNGFYGVFAAGISALTIGAHIYPLVQLFNYRKHIRLATSTNNSDELHKAVMCIRNFFRYIVIAVLICIGLYLLVMLLMMLLMGA